jgi:type I restriction-modification system DNA methylase subunit
VDVFRDWPDIPGLLRAVSLQEIADNGFNLSVRRYVSAWELVCHAVTEEDIAGQRLFRIVRECPLSTLLDPPVGHAYASGGGR